MIRSPVYERMASNVVIGIPRLNGGWLGASRSNINLPMPVPVNFAGAANDYGNTRVNRFYACSLDELGVGT